MKEQSSRLERKIKKTIAIPIDKEPIFRAIFSKMNFLEVERVATGGMMSEPQLLITYEGWESDYHFNQDLYVVTRERPQKSPEIHSAYSFYSLRVPLGWHPARFPENEFNTILKEFKERHDKEKVEFEVKSLSVLQSNNEEGKQ